MARISEHVDEARDIASGKPEALIRSPWNDSQPRARQVQALRDKARQRLAGGKARFTSDEIQDALARLILGDG